MLVERASRDVGPGGDIRAVGARRVPHVNHRTHPDHLAGDNNDNNDDDVDDNNNDNNNDTSVAGVSLGGRPTVVGSR